jgi:hypothetical protein
MTIELRKDSLYWKNMFKEYEIAIPEGGSYIYGPKDKLIYVEYQEANTGKVIIAVYTPKAELKDKRSYSVAFKNFYIEGGLAHMVYFDYGMNAWVSGRFMGNAGVTAIKRVS